MDLLSDYNFIYKTTIGAIGFKYDNYVLSELQILEKAKTRKNITLGQLKTVFRRGQAAWLTGSRPRIGMQQWAMARVNSYLRGSRKHDTDLRRKRKK